MIIIAFFGSWTRNQGPENTLVIKEERTKMKGGPHDDRQYLEA